MALVNDLDVSDELCDELMSQDIFSPLMIEYIKVSFGGICLLYIMKQILHSTCISLLNRCLLLINNI